MQKNKSEKIILSAPKTAATLIIAATLNIAPTVGHFSNISNLQSIFRMTDPLKIVVCYLKLVI
jgi:hypothetical protein